MEDRLNHLSHLVIGRAIEVHKELARKNHALGKSTSSLRARKLLN